ncbi:MAG: molecular chaperone DnaK [Nitrospirales bacterium]|nr:MAG: molecular chaperone DnaK [Nitrospirales bacterium]
MNHTDIDVEYFREKLLTLREEITKIERTADEAAETVELDQTKIGRVSRMDALQSQAMAKESQQRRHLRKQRIETALQRIEKDIFGLCVRCEDEIHPKRLAFDPTILLCLTCANQNET